jgi:hypothetical protein
MNLEKRVIDGGFYCIRSIAHDLAEKSLIIEFIRRSEEPSPVKRLLTFSNIEEFSDELNWDDDNEVVESKVIDSLIGLDEYPENEKVRYVVHTEVREMIFYSKESPQIKDVQSAAI